jgi:hypothetical protein
MAATRAFPLSPGLIEVTCVLHCTNRALRGTIGLNDLEGQWSDSDRLLPDAI